MPRRKQIRAEKALLIDQAILELHQMLVCEYIKICEHSKRELVDIFDERLPRRSNNDRVTRLHNKLNATITKRNYMFLYEPCKLSKEIRDLKKQMIELQLKCKRRSMQKTRVDNLKRELDRLHNSLTWNKNALSVLEDIIWNANSMSLSLSGRQ
jgi:hypothetical protein